MDKIHALEVINVLAVLVSPFLAVQAQTYLERRRQKKESRLRVFRILMATRAKKLDPNHVEALNLIAIEFYGEKSVIRAWDAYIDHLSAPLVADQSWADKMNDLFSDLMEKMGQSLGFEFTKGQIKREAYTAKATVEVETEFTAIRKGLVDVLTGKASIPIHSGPPVVMLGQVPTVLPPAPHTVPQGAQPLATALPPHVRELKPGDKL